MSFYICLLIMGFFSFILGLACGIREMKNRDCDGELIVDEVMGNKSLYLNLTFEQLDKISDGNYAKLRVIRRK